MFSRSLGSIVEDRQAKRAWKWIFLSLSLPSPAMSMQNIYLSKQIFLRRNTSSVTLFVARFSVTSMVMVKSTSAGRMPVHRMPIENVSISIGIFPVREIFIVGRGRTAGSDVTIFMLYGSYGRANGRDNNNNDYWIIISGEWRSVDMCVFERGENTNMARNENQRFFVFTFFVDDLIAFDVVGCVHCSVYYAVTSTF